MVEAQEQAKQLDSVTDRVQEKEVDVSKAMQAMSSLSMGGGGGKGGESSSAPPASTAAGSTKASSAAPSASSNDDTAKAAGASPTTPAAPPVVVAVDPKDVQLIVDELEVTRETAERALRKALAERASDSTEAPVVSALRILVTSISA